VPGLNSLLVEKFSANRREIFVFLAGQAAGTALNFVIIKIIAQAGAAVYGEYVLIATAAAFAGQLYYGPFQQGFIRYYYKAGGVADRPAYDRLISSLHSLGVLLFLLPAAFVFIAAGLSGESGPLRGLVLPALVFTLASRFSEFFNGLLNVARKREANALLQTAEKLAGCALLFVLLVDERLTTGNIAAVLAASYLLFGAWKGLAFGWRFPRPDFGAIRGGALSRGLVSYSLPFIAWGVAMWLQLNGEKWVLGALLSTEDVGYYGLMAALTNAFVALPSNVLGELFQPLIFRNFSTEEGDRERGEFYIRTGFRLTLLLALVAAAVFSVAGTPLLSLLGNDTYTGYAGLLPFLAIGSGLFYAGQALCSRGLAFDRPHLYLFPKVLSGVLSILLYFVLIRMYGMSGVAAAVVLAGAAYLALVMFANRKLPA
jgi:O-antigen/teichoic acid export membrane protein